MSSSSKSPKPTTSGIPPTTSELGPGILREARESISLGLAADDYFSQLFGRACREYALDPEKVAALDVTFKVLRLCPDAP
jgi:hypothetical protein